MQPGGIDDLAGALTPEQPPFEEVLLTPAASRDGVRRTAGRALVGEEPFQHPDRGVEGRANRTVLHLAVPPAVLELLADQPGDHAIHLLVEVGTQRDDHAVDARLDLAVEERLAGVLPTAVLSDLGHRPAHPVIVGIDTEVVQGDEAVGRGSPGLALGPLFAWSVEPACGEQGAARPLAVVCPAGPAAGHPTLRSRRGRAPPR